MPKFRITPTVHSEKVITARLGGNASNTRFSDSDVGKAVKLVGESNYALCSAGDAIEGIVTSVETGLYDQFVLGGVVSKGFHNATVGSGTVAVGDMVVAAAQAAVQTAQGSYVKVAKAADQAVAKAAMFKARVVSLGDAATGATGSTVVIELL